VNAGGRLTLPGDRLSFAVAGRNLANKHYAVPGNDKTAGNGEVVATAGEPRAVMLQAETRF
jgi:outer membrane receptor protein involved in Fe transport